MRPSLPILALLLAAAPAVAAEPPKLKVLVLGDAGHHQPAARFDQLRPVFAARNIDLTYTEKLDDLNPKTLAGYDGLMVYANHTKIAPEQEKALLDYVASGKGFIPVHCASYCFLNSPAYIGLVGAQFRSHGTGVFRTEVVKPDHPVVAGFQSFSSWDETYVHTKHNEKDRTVLEVRTDGDLKEAWTWVRTQGKGRVFYTAWGHDQRTWGHPGFQNLLERGVRWACGQDPAIAGSYFDRPKMTELRKDVTPFEYVPAKVPFYPPSKQWGTIADPITKMQKPLPVEESVKHFVTPVDFEVKVFVTEDKLGGKPIAMAWDEQGRLWVSVTVDYPNEMRPAGQGRDKIVVCEDTDGDGVCDKVTEFADKLSIPTSLLPYAGGVIVHQAPVTLFLKDTDGDGKADVRQELLRGWATNDTHAGPSNLHYGFDNWVYGAVGYAGFNGEVNGEKVNFKQGYYRFKVEAQNPSPNPSPEKGGEKNSAPPSFPGKGAGGLGSSLKITKLEFLRSTNNNTWGLAFDESGQLFGSTANGCPIVHMPIPNRYYERVKGLTPTVLGNIAPDNHIEPITDKVRQVDWHGGFTAASNCSIYTARTYPKEYWNKAAFVSEPTGHLTATFVLQPNGASYSARYGWNLLAGDDEWSAPIDAQVGPDGHVWVIDWYNFIVQHNPTPAGFKTGKGNAYETDLRDNKHGRIYRVVYTKAKPEPRVNLKDATPEKLVETLKHHNMGWRLHAQRLLVARGKRDVVPALVKLVKDETVDELGTNGGAVHALWTLDALGSPPPKVAVYHPAAAVRRAALLTQPREGEAWARILLNHLGNGTREYDPSVLLASLLAAAEFVPMNKSFRTEVGLRLVWRSRDRDMADPAMRTALVAAGAAHAKEFLFVGGYLGDGAYPVTREALDILEVIARHYAAGGDTAEIPHLIFWWAKDGRPESIAVIVRGLAAGWPAGRRLELGPDGAADIGRLLAKLPPGSKPSVLKLAQVWGVKGLDAQLAEITKGLLASVADPKVADADRAEAAKQVVEFRPEDDEAATTLLAAVSAQTPPAVAAGIFEALAGSKSKVVGAAVVAKLKDLSPAVRPTALRLVLAKPDSAGAFLDAVEKGTIRFDVLALDQKTALAAHPDKTVAERAKKLLALGGGLPNADRQKVIEELMPVIKKTGDVANGKKVFAAQCAKCHKYAGEGTQIGPDLTGMAVHPKEELLIHILDPSRSVEGNYKAYRVVTTDGRTIIGLLASESKTAVEVVDAEAKRFQLSRDDIESLKETDKSLMPEGFEKQVKPDELADLLEFLTQKGKYVPLPLDKMATVVSTKDMFFDAGGTAERLIFPDWKPKTFNGVPFVLVDPRGEKVKNAVMLNGPNGVIPPTMPKAVSLPFNGKAKAIHMLGGVGGWSFPADGQRTVSVIVRLHYEDGKTEDHELRNGVHFADYIRRVDVPGSQFAFALRGQQIRYLSVAPKRDAVIKTVELVKGAGDRTAPIVMAVTAETP
ncbi:MAG: Trehalose utilization [Gemmataceae bacterium]|nr:Trehalose utilization [Gemmataceae bacterium]